MTQNLLRLFSVTSFLLMSGYGPASSTPDDAVSGRPNFVLIVFEDMSPRVGAFGDTVAHTPVLDAFAEKATLYPNTFTAAGVCAPSRAALITGVYQQKLGTQHMRAKGSHGFKAGGPIEYEAAPPAHIKAFPELLRRAGYYTTNNGKTDYQFGEPFTVWDQSDANATWRTRKEGQPFFSMFNLLKTHESYIWPEETDSNDPIAQFVAARNKKELAAKVEHVKAEDVMVPPYLPDSQRVREDIARHYNNIAFQEQEVALILADLQEDKLLDNTIVIITTDHGDGLPRMKRTLYDSGIKVPLMIRMPDQHAGTIVREDMVSFIDFSATILSLAGIDVPAYIDGQTFLGKDKKQRNYIFASEDRHDELLDRYRAVRDEQFKYIRNYMPENALLRHIGFRDYQPAMQEIWRLSEIGGLTPLQQSYLDTPRPAEELYDTATDPHEITNLANDPRYTETLSRMRSVMDKWIASLGPREGQDEEAMIRDMWPSMVQPTTATPSISLQKASHGLITVTLLADTPGASIGYRTENDPEGQWHLYSAPIEIEATTRLYAKAIRYGYKESTVMQKILSPK